MLSVVLSRTTPLYSPGEDLAGDVLVNSTYPCRVLDLTVNYVGLSCVGFVVPQNKDDLETCAKFEETATHLDVLHPLVKSYRGIEIQPGMHTYSFCLKLPKLLPSSYRSPYGNINYYIQVHLQTTACTLTVRQNYYVRAPVNIELFTSCQDAQSAETVNKIGFLTRKPFRLKVSLPKTIFEPGENIPVTIEVSNESNRQVQYLFCTLKQVTTVLIELPDRTESRVTKQNLITVAHKVAENCPQLSWNCQLSSPIYLTPTITSSIVFVTYVIQVSAKLSRVTIPPDVKIPIVFGIKVPTSISASTNESNQSQAKFQQQPQSKNEHAIDEVTTSSLPHPTVLSPRRRVTICSQPILRTALPFRRGDHLWSQNAINTLAKEDESDEDDVFISEDKHVMSIPSNTQRRNTFCIQSEFGMASQESLRDSPEVHSSFWQNTSRDLTSKIATLHSSGLTNLRRRVSVSSVMKTNLISNISSVSQSTEEVNENSTDCFSISEVTEVHKPKDDRFQGQSGRIKSRRKVGIQLHVAASQLKKRLSRQWESNITNQFRRFSCEQI